MMFGNEIQTSKERRDLDKYKNKNRGGTKV
jgi:hypothetical protein